MDEQLRHYENKLAIETDSWDLKVALEAGGNIIVIDARSPEAYQKEHVPGAINVPGYIYRSRLAPPKRSARSLIHNKSG